MTPMLILGAQTAVGFVAFALIARWHVLPRLAGRPIEEALIPLVWIHVFRVVALSAYLPGQVSPDIPEGALSAIVAGDTLSALLALVTVVMLETRARGAIAAAWIFNVVGLADWVLSQVLGVRADVFRYPLGASALVFAFYVPALVVSHAVMIYWLARRAGHLRAATASG